MTSSSPNEYVRLTDKKHIKRINEHGETNSVLQELCSDWTNVKYHNYVFSSQMISSIGKNYTSIKINALVYRLIICST